MILANPLMKSVCYTGLNLSVASLTVFACRLMWHPRAIRSPGLPPTNKDDNDNDNTYDLDVASTRHLVTRSFNDNDENKSLM